MREISSPVGSAGMGRKLEKLPDAELHSRMDAFAPGSEEHDAARLEASIRDSLRLMAIERKVNAPDWKPWVVIVLTALGLLLALFT